jgi:hypothetical protein
VKKLLTLATASSAIAAGGLLITAPAAHADVTDPNMLIVNSGVNYEGCNEVPYSLKPLSDWGSAQSHAMGNVYGTYNYQVDMKVIGPDGTEADSRSVTRSADDISQYGSDTDHFFVCGGAGNYSVQATGNWCWVNYKPTTAPQYCQRISFQKPFSLRAAKTEVTVKAAKSYRISSKPLKVTASVSIERSTGMFGLDSADVKLQYKRGGKWVNYGKSSTGRSGLVKFSVRFADTGAFQLRAVVASDEDHAGSTSKPIKVKVAR